MYTDKRNILQLVSLLRAFGINKIVCSPGSRNAPIISAFAECEDFDCCSVTDERSAGFMALGMALRSGKPAVVCVTSGSALLNLHPAVAEAFYQQIPLVVISADRPAAWIGQMDGQTLPQSGVFGSLVRKSVNLPEVYHEEDEWYCNRLVNEALLELNHHVSGPVHINVPLSEPLFRYTVGELPSVRKITRIPMSGSDDAVRLFLTKELPRYKRPMVVAGQMPAGIAANIYPDNRFAWVSELLGNTPRSVRGIDAALHAFEDSKEDMRPDLLITYGGHIISKRLKAFLRNTPHLTHWHITPDGEVMDLYGVLTTVVEASPQDFFSLLGSIDFSPADYAERIAQRCMAVRCPQPMYSELMAVQAVMSRLPEQAVLHLANSSVIRLAELFALPQGVEVCANRGVNGIEGSLSTAIGYASCDDRLNVLLVGDLSFFYDMNALRNENIGSNVRIMMLNNGGGAIFHTIPGMNVHGETGHLVTATHGTTAEAWAVSQGFHYLGVENESSLCDALHVMMGESETPIFVEVFTDMDIDTKELKEYYEQIRNCYE